MAMYTVELSLTLEFEDNKLKDAKQSAKYMLENILWNYGDEGGTGEIIRVEKKEDTNG